ncbi:MAG: TIR domain-containing protein [Coriobacteriia bacterium]|nr:TIR domain-containing protein [Coriobacteriia bacterium]
MSKNIFVSHSWNYSDDYDRLMKLLENRSNFSYTDYSVTKSNPRDSFSDVESAIKYCSMFVFIAGVYASYSDSIKKEIGWAKKYDKPILAIRPYGAERISVAAQDADKTVNWSTESIVAAIRELW